MADRRLRSQNPKAIARARARAAGEVQPQPSAGTAGIAAISFPGWRWWVFCALILVFARYYYWTIDPGSGQARQFGPYNLLTDAFYNHQTYLLQAPAPQMLALPDPYDPAQNERYRFHDASLYHGRYYYYFGPAPVLFLYLPYVVITGEELPDRIGTWLFATAAFLMSCLLLKFLLSRYWPQSPQWLFYFLCLALGFSNSFPYLLRRPAIYETAIASGQFFLFLALYTMARAAFGGRFAIPMAALAGVCLAAAVASRPNLVLASGVLVWLLLLGGAPLRVRSLRLTAALIPLAIGAALLAYYNYVRFDSPFEFGNHYQLAAVNVRKLQYFRFSIFRTLRNLWFSVLEPPRLHSTFPFFKLAPAPPDSLTTGIEVVAGVVWLAPLTLLLAGAYLVWKKMPNARRREWAVCTGVLGLLGAALIGMDATVGATMRYQADFAALLIVAAALVIAGLSAAVPPAWSKRLPYAVVALGLLGIMINGAIGMTGYYDNFRAEAPLEYRKTAAQFEPVARVLSWFGIPP